MGVSKVLILRVLHEIWRLIWKNSSCCTETVFLSRLYFLKSSSPYLKHICFLRQSQNITYCIWISVASMHYDVNFPIQWNFKRCHRFLLVFNPLPFTGVWKASSDIKEFVMCQSTGRALCSFKKKKILPLGFWGFK